MTKPPTYKVKFVSHKKMIQLFAQFNFDARLKNKDCIEKCDELTDLIHAAFCCSQRVCRYVDTAIDEEIAVIAHTTYAGDRKPPKTTITKLLIGTVIFRHAFQQH